MGAMASQITNLTIVYSTAYSGADQRKHNCSWWGEFTVDRWISPQMVSDAENIYIWWRHHGEFLGLILTKIRA